MIFCIACAVVVLLGEVRSKKWTRLFLSIHINLDSSNDAFKFLVEISGQNLALSLSVTLLAGFSLGLVVGWKTRRIVRMRMERKMIPLTTAEFFFS